MNDIAAVAIWILTLESIQHILRKQSENLTTITGRILLGLLLSGLSFILMDDFWMSNLELGLSAGIILILNNLFFRESPQKSLLLKAGSWVIFMLILVEKVNGSSNEIGAVRKIILVGGAYLTASIGAGSLISMAMEHWKLDPEVQEESLKNAGKYIGWLERSLILTLLLFDQWSAIGFLATAKSVFRFGDLSRSKDRKLTEYILIGTLLSYSIAIAIGSLTKLIL